MDRNSYIKLLLKRQSALSSKLVSYGMIIEESTPYGDEIKHLRTEIAWLINSLKSFRGRYSPYLKKSSLDHSLLNELGFTRISFSVN